MVKKPKIDGDLFGNIPVPVAELGAAEQLACLRLIRSENIGPATFRALINAFGGAEAALAVIPDVARRGGRRKPIRICSKTKAEQELAAAARLGAIPIFTIEPGYPKALAALDLPPPLIYATGQIQLLNQPTIAIVGSRNCSGAGAAFARQLASELGHHQLIVASGLARGIDGAAHRAALASGTVAVLAGGLDIYYPPEHEDLHREIAVKGCVISECPPGFQPRGKDFPRRNRIISGLSLGVVVVEAAKRSGSLTTARFAAEQGRDVFAVPGHPLDPRAAGTNALLKAGAILTTSVDDVIAEITPQLGRAKQTDQTNDTQSQALKSYVVEDSPISNSDRDLIAGFLGPAPVSVDEICRLTNLRPGRVQAIILELSIAGKAAHHGRNLVSLKQ